MTRPAGRGFVPVRDLPTALWLLAAVAVALAHPLVPAPRWLMIHLLLLGAVTHSILVWSRHFADAVLHTAARPGDQRRTSIRLGLLNGGVLAVVAGVPAALWPLTLLGAVAVAAAVVWHGGTLLGRLRRALPARFGVTVRYYVATACLLPVGAGLGVALALDPPDPLHQRLLFAHVGINVLGWMGLTVVGTLVTLWPTMLRTRIAAGAERSAGRALVVLVLAVLLLAAGALGGWMPVAALGIVGYLAGLGMVGGGFVAAARGKPPSGYATWSVLAALLWLAGTVLALLAGVLADLAGSAPTWVAAGQRLGALTPFLATGFGAQVLLGALSYLVPVVLRGGPVPVRAATAVLDRGGALRVVATNAGLLVCVLPVPGTVRALTSAVAIGALASFLPLAFLAMRASRRAKREAAGACPGRDPGEPRGPVRPEGERPAGQVRGLAVTGLALVALAVAVGASVDPAALGGGAAPAPAPARPTPTGFVAYDPTLPPLTGEKVHRRTLTIREQVREVAPGVTQDQWTYDGTAPGPTLHGRVGDIFEITLHNAGGIGHSIDFHAGALAPDAPMRTIPPGQSLVYRFTANRAGVWMYHCSTMPMSAHIANGLFGAVVIEPPELPHADRSYLIVQSEQYRGGQGQPVDLAKLDAERPDAVVFNGYPDQYDRQPLPARVGERVRIWLLDAGPDRATSFHVVGGQFDTVFAEGAYLLHPGTGGSQALALAPAQGGFVELTFPEPGRYPFLSHLMVDAERGAHGTFAVTR